MPASPCQGEEGVDHLSLCCVLCHQVPIPIQQWAHTFPFAVDRPLEVLVAFPEHFQIQLQMGLDFPRKMCLSLKTAKIFIKKNYAKYVSVYVGVYLCVLVYAYACEPVYIYVGKF